MISGPCITPKTKPTFPLLQPRLTEAPENQSGGETVAFPKKMCGFVEPRGDGVWKPNFKLSEAVPLRASLI